MSDIEILSRRLRQLVVAAAGKARGMSQVNAYADDDWKEEAREYLIWYLKHHEQMFTDELWDVDDTGNGIPMPPNGKTQRALGPIVLRLANEGCCTKNMTMRARGFGREAPGTVWVSNIYGQL